ncbi:MAG TPA: CvpA family protein [Candidatus Flavonifractor intestinipullorum]|uniref:CvpA family protein n=1 Tax=Candidatus Flavonifractor intestinipullorum TaxID=2838587 RepID=A0A9D2S612_9FIRM|nr:CvpA family protein [Candidatus Flavonifractor intestinipullorum]
MPYILDLIVIAVVALFVWRGAARGLVLSLCGLMAFVVAFAGAGLAAQTLSPAVADALEPRFAAVIEEQLDAQIQQLPEGVDPSGDSPLSGVLEILENLGLYDTVAGAVEDAVQGGMTSAAADTAAAVAASVAQSVAYRVIFAVAFALLLAAWGVLSRTLNLMARLPVLHFLNKTGGALIGVIQAFVILSVAVWLLQVLGHAIPQETVQQTWLLKHFLNAPALLAGLAA